MFYYRYRPISELTMNELLYDELLFASAEECNDPYEEFPFIVFKPDREKWSALLRFAWDKKTDFVDKNSERFVEFLCKQGSICLRDFCGLSFSELNDSKNAKDLLLFALYVQKLKSYVESYTFHEKYFVCFSKTKDEYLMWSHYADQHRGLSLIFLPEKNALRQRSDSIRNRITIGSVTETIGNRFRFRDVGYKETVLLNDGFDYFPADVCRKYSFSSEEERINFVEHKERYILEKSKCWEYEQEVRLLLPAPSGWAAGKIEYSKNQRLFHYDTTQLVGIIFGSRTTEDVKNRVMEIVSDKQLMLAKKGDLNASPNIFMFFQAQMSNFERLLNVVPIGGNFAGDFIKPSEPCFNNFYRRWNLASEK